MIIYPIFQHFLASSGQLKPCLLLHILLVWVRELNTNCFDTSSAQILSIFVIVLGGWKRVCEYAFTSRIAWNLLQLPIGLTRKMLSWREFWLWTFKLGCQPLLPTPWPVYTSKTKEPHLTQTSLCDPWISYCLSLVFGFFLVPYTGFSICF